VVTSAVSRSRPPQTHARSPLHPAGLISVAGPQDTTTTHHPPTPLQFFKGKAAKAQRSVKRELVIPQPSYSVPLGLLAISGAAAYEGVIPLAAIAGVLAAFLTIQASRVQ
jgi:hypothetical protein